ncbi:hypothetical protein G7075_10450 [Phycicoccus sp. HDW14]|uniref:hypothetical protein n=1 Tax=Phycicoccus sp. HDW14 TaxID=2714941 RepID=UPI00140C072D|nr:hypothetical protein [Phycicoccus sp. HDW14]QIM21448.1 hypothetical protein G7075_10450 [Phycicoccus sp. HDW14]
MGSPVGAWSAAQFGLVTRAQASAAGMTSDAIEWKVASGRWTVAARGVYLTTPGRSGWEVRAGAAFLRVHSTHGLADAALVGSSAAFVLGLLPTSPAVVRVGIPHARRVEAPHGVSLHRMVRFDEVLDDLAYPWRTTVSVTVLDCAAEGDADAALALVARAVQRGLTTAERLDAELRARGRHRHGRLLRQVLGEVGDGAHSAAELRYVRDVETAHGLPRGRRQAAGNRGAVHDTEYEGFATIVEVDGRLGHERWADRVRDGRRDRGAAGRGAFTTRVFWPDVAVTPCRTAVEVGSVLRARGWLGSPRPCRRTGCVVPRR